MHIVLCVHLYVYVCVYSPDVHTYVCVFANPIEIPPVKNLMAIDECTTVKVSWDVIASCRGLSYNVILTSSDGVLGPFTTNGTTYNFTNVETLNGMLYVTVFAFNENARAVNATVTAVNTVSPEG